jgi:hypothetical protein
MATNTVEAQHQLNQARAGLTLALTAFRRAALATDGGLSHAIRWALLDAEVLHEKAEKLLARVEAPSEGKAA